MKVYSNEIVFRGHPDKVCDQISAAILDECLKGDRNSRVGVEVVGGKGIMLITGEITTQSTINARQIAKRVLKDVGYSKNIKVIDNIGKQSGDINQGVDKESETGAGDQGMMFGYATNETTHHLPKAQVILQEFAIEYEKLRKEKPKVYKPDGKAQITGYYENKRLKKIKTFTISFQNENATKKHYKEIKQIATNIANKHGIKVDQFLLNPTGKFEKGGFDADAGLTGRKIVVDAYQSFANVGGGCMNGKDPTKVDVSGAHKARQLAIRLLEEKSLQWCEVQLSYAIGLSKPLAIYISSDKGEIEPDENLYEECKVGNIIKDLNLLLPKYEKRAKYGHFGVETNE